MSKRKKAPPKRVDEEKRSRLTWNMGDGDRSLQIIDDEDPSLMFEQQGATTVLGWDSQLMQANSSNSPRSDTTALPVRLKKVTKTTPLACVEEAKPETVINIEEDSREPKKVYENYFVDEDDEHLNHSLNNCHAMVEVHSTSGLDGNWQCEVGSFKISVLQPNDVESRIGQCISVPDVEKFWLYGSEIPGCSILYYEFNAREDQKKSGFVWKKKYPFLNRMRPVNQRKVLYYLASTDLPFEILEAVQSTPNQKHFRFVCKGYSDHSNEVEVAIYLQEAGLSSVQHPSEQPSKSRALQDIYKLAQAIMSYFYGIGPPDSVFTGKRFSRKHDIKDFFRNIKEIHEKTPPELRLDVQHPTLKPVLRPYQKQGVLWMLQNERYKDEEKAEEEKKEEVVHQLYEEVTMKDGQHLFYNKTGGIFVKEKPKAIINPPGGLLADEMGLGKTVEVLACMLLNPRKDLKEPGSPCAVKTWVKDRVISPKKEVTPKAEDTIAKDPSDIDSCDVTPVHLPLKDVLSGSSLPPEDGSLSMKHVKEETLPASGYDEGLFKDSSSASGDVDVMAKETVSNRKLSEDIVNVDINIIDNSSKVTKSASVPTPSVIQLGPTGNFGSLGGTSILKQSVVLMKSHNGGSPQKEKSSKNDGLGDGLDKLKDKSGNDDTIPFGDSMAEYDLGVLDGGMNESSRWDFWLKRKQVVLERPKKLEPPISSGATLIISPNAICHQWVEEIHKHVKEEKLKVFVYGGVYKHRFIQPQTLANHDIVITTYETLSREINYVDLPHSNSEKGRRLRHPKRFMAIPSPIVAVEWWRICLDEAQMVECTTTRTAEMALRLSAVNRWCVTGTPIHHDLADLYGLLLFLGVDPYWVKHWWDTMLYNPYCYGQKEPMHQAIAKVLWRTSKVDVIDQLGLPTQSEKIHWLKFSPIEEHFYRQQYEHHYKQATNMLMKWSDNRKKLSSLDRHTLHWLLNPLVNLRQACCHPQAVRGAFLNVHKTTMTMEEILTQLTKKSKTECEESHRQMVAAMNGMAAIHIIKEEYVEAVEVYRDVLRAVVEHENQIRTDKIQQLHTLHNLDEILSLGVEGVGRTLRDDQLKPQCKEIKEEYLAKAVANVVVAHEALEAVQENIQELSAELEGGVNWWADVIQYALAAGLDDVLVDRVRSELQDTSSLGRDSLANKFRNVNGMEYVLNILLEQLEEAHDNLTVSLTELDDEPTPNSVEEAVVCCLRPAGEVRKTCCFCKADELFSVYESKLFSFKEQQVFANVQEDGQYSVTTKRQGTWADSELEKAIKILASFTRHIAADASLSEYGSIHMKVFDALKKEFKCLRNKWLYLRERVSAIDELNMATTRYRLRLPGEEPSDPPQPNVLDPVEVDVTKSKLSADKAIAESELRKKLGQLIYLRNLEKAHDHLEGGSNPEACPICQKELGDEWSVMRCGHFFCMDCIHIMLNDYSFGLRRKSLKCAICRNISLHSEISYVSLKKTSNTEEGEECFQVKGDHSTKVTAVVRCLKQIQLNDPGAKALVFSTWQEVLNVIAQGLRQNNIGFKSLHAQNKFQANLHSFRSDDDVSVLLLPVHSGANGLNLIEATHILLVEPVLNQAQELQAIGRIHRIGQTKPTFVHRFIVKATIEEKMHSMLKSIQLPIDSHNDEESNLTIGDLWSLFSRRDVEGEEEGESSDGASGIRPDLGGESNNHSVPDDVEQSQSYAEESQASLSLESDRPTGSEDIDEPAMDTVPWVSEHVTV